MTEQEAVRFEQIGAVAVLTVDRPERRNAWSVGCVEELIAGIKRANADDMIGAIVLTGAGSTYCGGADIKDEPRYDEKTGRRLTPVVYTMGKDDRNWIKLIADSKPFVVALNGAAVGIGATHTLAADIRIAAESASISFPFLRLGAMPECGCTGLLPRLIGAGRALDLILRSAAVSAGEALQMGLVTRVYPDDQLMDEAVALAQQLAELPPLQVKLTKRMFMENAYSADPDAVMAVENRAFVEMLKTLKKEKPLGG